MAKHGLRLPWAPFEQLLLRDPPQERIRRQSRRHEPVIIGLTNYEIAEFAGMSVRTVNRFVEVGTLMWWHADRLAMQVLGMHPCEVWGDQWWMISDLMDLVESEQITLDTAQRHLDAASSPTTTARTAAALRVVTLYINIGFGCHSCDQWIPDERTGNG